LIAGDFNFHFDVQDSPGLRKMLDLIDTFGLSQDVNEPTHSKGHCIDWLLHRPLDDVVSSCSVSHELTSDHFCVVFDLNVAPPLSMPIIQKRRSLRAIDRDAFRVDLGAALSSSLCSSVEELDCTLHDLLDKHAPVSCHKIRAGGLEPWYASVSKELREAKKAR